MIQTKHNIVSAIKSQQYYKTQLRSSINLSILQTLLRKCQNFTHFKQILSHMIFTGFINETYAASKLLKFSTDSSFVSLDFSRRIFDNIEYSNGFIYNSMMNAYLQRNLCCNVISLYKSMIQNCVSADNYTYPILIQACVSEFCVSGGKQVHDHVIKMGLSSDVYVENNLIHFYGVCGDVISARKVFDESCVLDLVSWNSILVGYVQMGDIKEAKLMFEKMPQKNNFAFNSMIKLYSRLGDVDEASRLFNEMPERDVFSWSSLISCYEKNEMYLEGLVVFKEMVASGVLIDEVVVVSVLSACAKLGAIENGRLIHGLVVKTGIDSYVNLRNACIHMYASCGDMIGSEKLFANSCQLDQISWNSMISGYMKCGYFDRASVLFDTMPEKDVVSWGAMISGCAQNDRFSETLALFQEMQGESIWPDETILVSIVSACTSLAALNHGKSVHAYITKHKLRISISLGTALIDMYMKSGRVENAVEVFSNMEEKRVSAWNALILGLATNGFVSRSFEMFSHMKSYGVKPNEITFVGVLGACCHMGLVEEGKNTFSSMVEEYKIEPNIMHYGCMIDLLGRAGLLREAEELIKSMKVAPGVATWGALLGACGKYGDKETGERVGRKLIELHPDHDGFHTLLSNLYASKDHWDDVLDIRGRMMLHGLVKTPGYSFMH